MFEIIPGYAGSPKSALLDQRSQTSGKISAATWQM